ncbi:GGDEF domain-containing protein [Lacticaseibacillus zhaodongensis]|uniref:GGDEF domain-containing protein n=1 Tax=Lacticaseibacillus zhaodongensis TaxID=2668065 RepID=UPI0012D34340|nr:GGDEF domain-containing protein [Lacticaseibacillus zhaodongensis]
MIIILLGLRITTFITNTLVLIGFALLFSWLQNAKLGHTPWARYRTPLSIILTCAFLILFHFSSILNIMQEKGAAGYGWTYLNFQLITVFFAVQVSNKRSLLFTLAALIGVWYWWLPNFDNYWLPTAIISLLAMYLVQRFGQRLADNTFLFFLGGFLFALPYLYANFCSLNGIDVGWPWQIGTLLILELATWTVQHRLQIQRRKQAKLMREARIDELTQLHNFRVFNEDLQAAYTRFQVDDELYALYTFDIDHFKQINDHYGHLVGNQVLQAVSKRLRELTKNIDFPAKSYRTGGEEFSFILFNIQEDYEYARRFSLHVQTELSKLQFTTSKGDTFNITVSMGQDRALKDDQNYLDLYNRADKYLYSSKRIGRDAVTVHGITIKGREDHPMVLENPDSE